jgi:hypothetical protein
MYILLPFNDFIRNNLVLLKPTVFPMSLTQYLKRIDTSLFTMLMYFFQVPEDGRRFQLPKRENVSTPSFINDVRL